MSEKDIYIAGKVELGEGSIQELASELECRVHRITYKWWKGERLPKQYLSHLDSSEKAADAMIEAVNQSNIFILFPDKDMLGAAIEFGVAIKNKQDKPEKELIVVIDPNGPTRQSVFYAKPGVVLVESVEQIRQRPWY